MPEETTRILFIGNSYTGRNNLPGLLAEMAASASPPRTVETDCLLANGMALSFHWNKGIAAEKIAGQPWDYVVLQEQSTKPWKSRGKMHDSVRLFHEAITSAGAKTALYLTWARQDDPERQAAITEAYASIGEELGAIVIPVGLAWEAVLSEHPALVLHDPDKSHPNLAGSYLAACVFYATLFGESPVGLPFIPKGLPEEDARILQETAWKTVRK